MTIATNDSYPSSPTRGKVDNALRPTQNMESESNLPIDYDDEEEELEKKNSAYSASSFALQSHEARRYGYRLGHYIGKGSSSVVRMAQIMPQKLKVPRLAKYAETKGHNQVAIKIIDIQHSMKDVIKPYYMPLEIQIHQELPAHDNVVKYLQSFKTDNFYYIVSELCECDLLAKINFGEDRTTHPGLPADVAKRYFRQVCRAVLHLHRYTFAHKDLKLENFLLDDDDMVKFSIFGFGNCIRNNPVMKTACCSFAYAAPEVLTNKSYDTKLADSWSLGIILYIMVNGKIPFDDDRIPVVVDLMRKQKFSFARTVSKECRDLIQKILQHQPESRLSIIEILHHPWLARKRISARTMSDPALAAKTHSMTKKVKVPYVYTDTHSPVPALAKKRPGVATVMVQHSGPETVTLRSRIQGKSNNLVLAMSPNIRGGKPPKLNSSRLANIVPKTPEYTPTPTKTDEAEFDFESPRVKSAAVGDKGAGVRPERAIPGAEIEEEDLIEMMNDSKPVSSNKFKNDLISMVKRANSPLVNSRAKSLGVRISRENSPSGGSPSPHPLRRDTPEDLGPRTPSPYRRPDGRMTGRPPLTPTQCQCGHLNDIAAGQDMAITRIWERDLSPTPQSPQSQNRMTSPQCRPKSNMRDGSKCTSPERQLMADDRVPSQRKVQKLMIGLTSKFRGKHTDQTTQSHGGALCISPPRASNECTEQTAQLCVQAYHPSGPYTPNGYPSPVKAHPTMRWAASVRPTPGAPPDQSTTSIRPTAPKTRGSPMTPHPPKEWSKTFKLSISASDPFTTKSDRRVAPMATPLEIMQGYHIKRASRAKKPCA